MSCPQSRQQTFVDFSGPQRTSVDQPHRPSPPAYCIKLLHNQASKLALSNQVATFSCAGIRDSRRQRTILSLDLVWDIYASFRRFATEGVKAFQQ